MEAHSTQHSKMKHRPSVLIADSATTTARRKTIVVSKPAPGEKLLSYVDEDSEEYGFRKKVKKRRWCPCLAPSIETDTSRAQKSNQMPVEIRQDYLTKAILKGDYDLSNLQLDEILHQDLSLECLKCAYIVSAYTINNYFGAPSPRSEGPRKVFAYLNQLIPLDPQINSECFEKSKNIRPPNYFLNLSVIKAVDLKSTDPDGLSDPYCKIWMNSDPETVYSTSVKERTLNPVWNEKFSFPIENVKQDVLFIDIWDSDPIGLAANLEQLKNINSMKGFWIFCSDFFENLCAFGKDTTDDFVGKLQILVSEIYSEGVTESFPLKPMKDEETKGSLQLSLKFSADRPSETIIALKRHLLLIKICLQQGLKEVEDSELSISRWDQILCPAALTLLFQHSIQSSIAIHEDVVCRFITVVHLAQENIAFDYQFLYNVMREANACVHESLTAEFLLQSSLEDMYREAVDLVYDICIAVINSLEVFDLTEDESKCLEFEFILRCINLCHDVAGKMTFPWGTIKQNAAKTFELRAEELRNISTERAERIIEIVSFITLYQTAADKVISKVFPEKTYTSLTYDSLDSILSEALNTQVKLIVKESIITKGAGKTKKILDTIEVFAKIKTLSNYIEKMIATPAQNLELTKFRDWFGSSTIAEWFLRKQEIVEYQIESIVNDDDLENKVIECAGRFEKQSLSVKLTTELILKEIRELYFLVSHPQYLNFESFFVYALHRCCMKYAEALTELIHARNLVSNFQRDGKRKLCVMANNLWSLAMFATKTVSESVGKLKSGLPDTKLSLLILCKIYSADISEESVVEVRKLIKRVVEARSKKEQGIAIKAYTTYVANLICVEATTHMAFEVYLMYLRETWDRIVWEIARLKEVHHKAEVATFFTRIKRFFGRAPNIFAGLLAILRETEKFCFIDEKGLLKEFMWTDHFKKLKSNLERIVSNI